MKLVLLPGLDGTGSLYQPLVQTLPADFSGVVVAYPKDKQLTYTELAELVKRQLPADNEDYVLVAESFSGPVAIQIAAERTANLRALVLSATFISNPSIVPRGVSVLLTAPIFQPQPPQFFVERFLLGATPPIELVELFQRARASVPAEVLAFRMRCVLNVDVRKEFAWCRLPILYLFGKQDRLVKRRSVEQMLRVQPHMCVAEVDGPHLLLQREPVKCFEAINQFLEAVS